MRQSLVNITNTMEQKDVVTGYMNLVQNALARKNYYEYTKLTNRGYKDNAFGRHLCSKVQDFIFSTERKPGAFQVLIIEAPPQHGKSTNVTETLASYILGCLPDSNVIGLSYGDELARKFGRENLEKVQNFGKTIFGIETDPNAPCTSLEFHIKDHNGTYLSRSLTSGVTGNPADFLLIDDPIKNKEEADSEGQRNKVYDGYAANLKTRLSANGKIIIILTRWHEDDLAGRILSFGNRLGNVTELRYPCECEDEATDPLGRKLGDALCPELGKDNQWVRDIKLDYETDPSGGGVRTWNSMYQGRPTSLGGDTIQAAWLRFWKYPGTDLPDVKMQISTGEYISIKPVDLPARFDQEIQSWDCTFKDLKTSDFVCGGYWARNAADYFLVDATHKVLSFTKTIEAIEDMYRNYPKSLSKYVENKANGPAVINSLQHRIPGMIPVEANNDKLSRLVAVTPVFKSGNVYFPHPLICPWVTDSKTGLIPELLAFPNGTNDDWVDMISQALNILMYSTRSKETKVLPEGTWMYPVLKERGYSDHDIFRAYRNGEIKLYMVPEKLKLKWMGR